VLYRKGGKFGAPKWARKWHGAVNKVGGGIKRANTSASDFLNKQVNGFEARIEFADPRSKMEKLNDGMSSTVGYGAAGFTGIGAGGTIGALLGGNKKSLMRGAGAGLVAGLGARALLGKKIKEQRIERSRTGNRRNAANAGLLNIAPAAVSYGIGTGLAIGGKRVLETSGRYGRSFRQWRGRMAAKMPVSKATQDARFAKAKPARAWVSGSQPRLAMESRMNATLQMFEGYGPYGYQDYYSAPGWDLRDARGKSARVFAPGAKKRMRRSAEWHEKKDNQKKLIAGAGVAAALLAGGGGLYLGRLRGIKAGRAMKEAEGIKNVVKFPKQSFN